MAVTSLAFTSNAEAQAMPTASLAATPSSVEAGGSVTADLTLDLDGVYYTSGLYEISYDPSVLTLRGCDVVSGGGACNINTNPIGFAQFVIENPFDGPGQQFFGGQIAELEFDVASQAVGGTSTLLDLEVVNFFDSSDADIGAIAVDATINIAEPEPEPAPKQKRYKRYRRFLRWLLRFLSRWTHRHHGWA